MSKHKFYIAYGSNLNINQMFKRCGNPRVYSKGYIKDYRLVFKGRRKESIFATIEPFSSGRVPVLVWVLDKKDEKILDIYEGAPHQYMKEKIIAHLEDGRKVRGLVYIMNPLFKQYGVPNVHYSKIIVDAYEMLGLNREYLDEALVRSYFQS